MDDLQKSIDLLNARREIALAKKAEADALVLRAKQAAWEQIKADPVIADFLTAINSQFGKPKKTKVVINDETIVDTW